MKVSVINLDHRTDRWESVQPQLKAFGIEDFQRFSAFSTPDAYRGNARSHYECLHNGSRMIFEDDVIFIPGATEIFIEALKQLPPDFDFLYLGGNLQAPAERYSDNLYRVTFAWGSYAIYYSEQGAQKVLKHFDPLEDGTIYDVWLKQQSVRNMKAFMVSPIIAWTRAGFSDVNMCEENYLPAMQENEKKYML